MESSDLKASVLYNFRQKYYNAMLNDCNTGLSKFRSEVFYHLAHSLALILMNRVEEGVHELEVIRAEDDVKLACTIGLLYANKLASSGNTELFNKLDVQMREYRKKAQPVDFYFSALVLATFGKWEKGLDYVEKSLNLNADLLESKVLKAWILLKLNTCSKMLLNVKDLLEEQIIANSKNLDLIGALCEVYLQQKRFDEAANLMNKIPNNSLVLLQKIRISFAGRSFEQTQELCGQVQHLEAAKVDLLVMLSQSANFDVVATKMAAFFTELESKEPNNTDLFLDFTRLFFRCCNRNEFIVKSLIDLLEMALRANSDSSYLMTELGFLYFSLGKPQDALKYFKIAIKINSNSFKTLLGLVLCEHSPNKIEEQLTFLQEMEEAQNSALFALVRAKKQDETKFILQAIKLHKNQLRNMYFGEVFLLNLNPDFILNLTRECLEQQVAVTSDLTQMLLLVVQNCPGLQEAQLYLAKVEHLQGEALKALDLLEQLPEMSEAHLLISQIHSENQNFSQSYNYLEKSISTNFKIREHPLYHYVQGLNEKNLTNYPDSVKAFSTSLSLLKNVQQKSIFHVEKASIYVQLIDTLNIIGQNEEALKLLEDATEDLKGSQEEGTILLLSAEQALKRGGNVQVALDLLKRISPKENCSLKAKIKYAEILLEHQKDKFAFIQCYKDLLEENATSEKYILLGDAFIKILQAEDALDAYNNALKLNPKDVNLIEKMGKALVLTHFFKKAITFYKDAIKTCKNVQLNLQLAELYANLKQFPKAESVLLDQLTEEDLTIENKIPILCLLSKVQEKSNNIPEAIKSLKNALNQQLILTNRLETKTDLGKIIGFSIKLAELSVSIKNNEKAIDYLKDGLEVCPNNTDILTSLAKLYMQMNYLELCQQTCTIILRLQSDNESASMMMADIAFRKVDFEMAQFHFTQLIVQQPNNWEALGRLIEILRRTGNIRHCQEYLKSERFAGKEPAGFFYCTGLYQWYSGNLNGALKSFNNSRQDVAFGLPSLYNMIEICLNPEDEMFAELGDVEDVEYRDARSMALKTTDRLLKELSQRLDGCSFEDQIRLRLLSNLRLLATKEKYNIERALDDLIAAASQPALKEHVGLILGISTAYTLQKQSQRAKNQLKRLLKATWTFEVADYLERCWLMLADYYVQSSKYEIATDLIQKVLQHNKACTKTYEYLGFIAEKEQRYRDAVGSYENAWKYNGKNNPGIGFKLAHSLMKCKRFARAIEVAQEVLVLSPDYPRIKKDILEKSLNNLKG